MNVSESDWKVYKRIRDLAQERYSQRVLDDAGRICRDESLPAQDRHAELAQLLRERDREMLQVFDSPRRSSAVLSLIAMWCRELVTESEMQSFSPGLQQLARQTVKDQ